LTLKRPLRKLPGPYRAAPAIVHEDSMKPIARFAMAATLALGSFMTPAIAPAADMRIYQQQDSGVCADRRFLAKITNRFRYQVRNVPHLPDVAITDFQRIRATLFEPREERRPIARQYCEADVVLSDGYTRNIWYLIEGGMGFAGIGDNVEFCVDGFDRWYVYNGRCRVLRPGVDGLYVGTAYK
jgi:capsid protein